MLELTASLYIFSSHFVLFGHCFLVSFFNFHFSECFVVLFCFFQREGEYTVWWIEWWGRSGRNYGRGKQDKNIISETFSSIKILNIINNF